MQTGVMELNAGTDVETFRALASETRLRILSLLAQGDRNIAEIGSALGLSQPTVTRHMQILEQVGLVASEYMPGAQGMQKRCRIAVDRVLVSLNGMRQSEDCVEDISMPVGLYTVACPLPTCGLVSSERVIGFLDEPQSFYHPERGTARLIWMQGGFVEYVFPNTLPTSVEIVRLEFVAEVCSECPNYSNDFPSDITVWVNGREIGTWTSPGDFGGKRGRLNPPWWADHMTQYGMMKVWSVDRKGCCVDGLSVPGPVIAELGLEPHAPITLRIGVKPDARHQGGFNLFGRGFGNYDQDPTLRLHYVSHISAPRKDAEEGGNTK